ncbi:zinc-finger domain of monoamine-oxidase A repressor R1 [Artemisia annua]|uniref:Zinc-finger domain of monoamine-oxidase A repressor R1 n=1 Tax=Artemisia annua TaxID=35608 RepID=A0A2U1NH28_ARTAN|nr:zinc-finger domain of monoamine-oxidase A repressor R1 [Artemisia annua]
MANDNTSPSPSNSNSKSIQKSETNKSQCESTQQKTLKRKKSPGVRCIGGRIYDSENGKTCHQCRQKTLDLCVGCTNVMANKKKCTLHFCKACLFNRYTEIAEKALESGNWICPRCRGICNCSFCMKKRGLIPTGVLVRNVKVEGLASVSNGDSLKKRRASENETEDEPTLKRIKEEANGESNATNEEANGESDATKEFDGESEEEKNITKEDDVAIQLPQGTELTNLTGIDLPSGDIGNALQLLEFCETFGEVLELQNGQPEILLRELTRANAQNDSEPLILFHIKLLSIIDDDMVEKYPGKLWLEGFKECIAESDCPSKKSLLELFKLQPHGSDELNFTKRLRLLNFLCDEALGTVKLRSWLEERNVEEKKKMKEKVIANREKEKNIKKKVQDEVARAILSHDGVPLSVTERLDLASKIRAETAITVAKSLEMRDVPHGSHVLRSEPVLMDKNGCKLWKLKSQVDNIGILLQDSCYGDTVTCDKWFAYSDQEKTLVDEFVTNSRKSR